MGNCQPDCTEAQILKLKEMLDNCIIEVGGLQQPTHSNSEYANGWNKVRSMVRNMAMALTGETIKFPCDIKQDKTDEVLSRALDSDDYPLYDDSEYKANEKDTIKTTSLDLLNAMDKVLNEPSVQQGLSFCKKVYDDVKRSLK